MNATTINNLMKDELPEVLHRCSTWLNWMTFDKRHGKTVAPYKSAIPKGGKFTVDPLSPANWVSLDEAIKRANTEEGVHVGISLTDQGLKIDDSYLWCLDFDGFSAPESDDDGALELVRRLRTYTEFSPSETGFKMYFLSDKPPENTPKIQFIPSKFTRKYPDVKKYRERAIEVFSKGRFLAMTGDWYSSKSGLPLRHIPEVELDRLLAELDQWAKSEGGQGMRVAVRTNHQPADTTDTLNTYGKLTESCLITVLAQIDHHDEQIWSDVCNALARAYGESGRSHFLMWSKDGYRQDEYVGFSDGECDARYDRALRDVSGKTGYGCKHLCELAGLEAVNQEWEVREAILGSETALYDALGISKDMVEQREIFSQQATLSSPDVVAVHSKQVAHIAEARGDVRNGKIFAAQAAGRFVYVNSDRSWLIWSQSECRWTLCSKSEHIQFAKQVAQTMLVHAAKELIGDSKRLTEIAKIQDQSKLLAMIDMAASEPSLVVSSMVAFDADPYLLGVYNGVIDLRSNKLLPSTPEQRITKQCNVEFDAQAVCPQWERFMLECFCGDTEMVDYMQRSMGYTLSGTVGEEVMHFWYGRGRNGKSVAVNVFSRILGDYAHVASTELITANDGKSKDTMFAALRGARLVLLNETKAGQRLDDSSVKLLAGREPIAARKLYGETFSYLPTAKLYVRGNHKPIVHDTSDGMWRRMRLVPFTNNVSEDAVDPELESKLWAERAGILNWMLEGFAQYQKRGLKPPQAIVQACNSYRRDADLLNDWLEDNTDRTDSSSTASVAEVYQDYRSWAQSQGVKPMSQKGLAQRLVEHGVSAGRTNRGRYYLGIRLLNPCPLNATAARW